MLTYIEKEFKAVRYCAILSFHRLVTKTIFATLTLFIAKEHIGDHNGGGGGGGSPMSPQLHQLVLTVFTFI